MLCKRRECVEWDMKPPLYLRPLTESERNTLREGLRSPEILAAEGKKKLVLVWDNASWHVSRRVRRFLGEHNRRVNREGGCKIVVCSLPVKAPWLNPIEPKWRHGKRAMVEPQRKLTVEEVRQRVYEHYRCEPHQPIAQLAA
jgi:transposase